MKILWLSHFVPYPDTGFGALQRSRGLLQGVAAKHDVSLVSLSRGAPEGEPNFLRDAKVNLESFCRRVVLVHARENTIPSQAAVFLRSLIDGAPYSTELFRSPAFADAVGAIVSKESFDLVHADTLGLAEELLPRFQCPVVLNHHNVESAMMARRAALQTNPLKRLFLAGEARKLSEFERHWCPQFALQIAVSGEDASAIAKFSGSTRVAVIENPVDCDYWTAREGVPANREILFVGGMDWYPNRDAVQFFCREVFPIVRQKFPDARFTVVGRSAEGGLDLGVSSESVTFTGFVPDVREHFHRARVFVCPMRDGGGTKLKVVNAFASGIPVVSTAFGASGLNVRHDVQLLLADAPAAFAEQIERTFADDALCARLQENGRKLVVDSYSTTGLAARLADEYGAIVTRQSD